jgi:hypothetical protein
MLLVACGGTAAVPQTNDGASGAAQPPTVSPATSSANRPAAVSTSSVTSAAPPTTGAATIVPAATSGGAPATSGAAGGAACSLATAADVAATYGESFDAGQASSPGGASSCLFKQSNGGVDTVTLTVVSGSQANTFYAANRAAYDATDVPSVGDRAFVSKDGGMAGVERGSLTILVHLVGFEKESPAALQSREVAFAQLVLSHAG